MSDKASTNSEMHEPFDPTRWALATPWLSESQADDRTPMNGAVEKKRSNTLISPRIRRRSHHLMFKKWSQAKHTIESVYREYCTCGIYLTFDIYT